MNARILSLATILSTLALQAFATPTERQTPLVPLGGQCGGITYKGPIYCAPVPGHTVECVVLNPYRHECQIVPGPYKRDVVEEKKKRCIGVSCSLVRCTSSTMPMMMPPTPPEEKCWNCQCMPRPTEPCLEDPCIATTCAFGTIPVVVGPGPYQTCPTCQCWNEA
ncbi:hypothetical protein BKA70DRAFT_1309078 [Coprinopsis sp. MPI-PUGE-AT-0042]|nr:hypothetical protein BKA70DRAFT_1309078 [Coprinopsis sp. MPI-PUGE-AT-0042]